MTESGSKASLREIGATGSSRLRTHSRMAQATSWSPLTGFAHAKRMCKRVDHRCELTPVADTLADVFRQSQARLQLRLIGLDLPQRHHPAPELAGLAGIDVVFAREGELAVRADAVDRQPGGERPDPVSFAHRHRPDARGDEQPPARIDAEGAQMNAAAVDGLDQFRLAGARVDREHRDAVVAAVEHPPAVELELAPVSAGDPARAPVAVGEVAAAAVGVAVDRAGALPRLDARGLGERALHEPRCKRPVAPEPVDVKLVLPLDRDVDPGLARVEIEMARAE